MSRWYFICLGAVPVLFSCQSRNFGEGADTSGLDTVEGNLAILKCESGADKVALMGTFDGGVLEKLHLRGHLSGAKVAESWRPTEITVGSGYRIFTGEAMVRTSGKTTTIAIHKHGINVTLEGCKYSNDRLIVANLKKYGSEFDEKTVANPIARCELAAGGDISFVTYASERDGTVTIFEGEEIRAAFAGYREDVSKITLSIFPQEDNKTVEIALDDKGNGTSLKRDGKVFLFKELGCLPKDAVKKILGSFSR